MIPLLDVISSRRRRQLQSSSSRSARQFGVLIDRYLDRFDANRTDNEVNRAAVKTFPQDAVPSAERESQTPV
jgi:hypothetical protein